MSPGDFFQIPGFQKQIRFKKVCIYFPFGNSQPAPTEKKGMVLCLARWFVGSRTGGLDWAIVSRLGFGASGPGQNTRLSDGDALTGVTSFGHSAVLSENIFIIVMVMDSTSGCGKISSKELRGLR